LEQELGTKHSDGSDEDEDEEEDEGEEDD